MPGSTVELPEVVVQKDYDGYFESLVRSWIDSKAKDGEAFIHKRIVITSGPYRASAVSYESRDDELHLDFYSALRRGFGELTREDEKSMIRML